MTPNLKPKIHFSRHLNMVSMLNMVCVCILIWLGHQQAMQFEELPMTAERSWRITRRLWRLKDQAVFVGLHFYLWTNPTCLVGIKIDFSQKFIGTSYSRCWGNMGQCSFETSLLTNPSLSGGEYLVSKPLGSSLEIQLVEDILHLGCVKPCQSCNKPSTG